ncbi:hypothetical protein FOL47_003393, partial [Perkinsus chesapeaki]
PANSTDRWKQKPLADWEHAYVAVYNGTEYAGIPSESHHKEVIGLVTFKVQERPTYLNLHLPEGTRQYGNFVYIASVDVKEEEEYRPIAAWLEVEPNNRAAIKLYRNTGFEKIG